VIRVLLADDHAVLREGLARILDAEVDLSVVGECGTARALRARWERTDWDVLVLDLALPDGRGLDLLDELRAVRATAAVVVLSMYPEHLFGPTALHHGASAYLTKGRPSVEVLRAIRRAAAGRRTITEEIADQLVMLGTSDAPHTRLSKRELEVFEMVVRGYRTTEIGERLGVSLPTVSTHLRHVKEKFGVETVRELVDYAIAHDLLG